MIIQNNSLILSHNLEGMVLVERILWIDPNRVLCVTIDIHANEFPVIKKVVDIETSLQNGEAQRIYTDEFDWIYSVNDESLTPGRRQRRDLAFEIIKKIVFWETGEVRVDAFYPGKRGKLIAEVAEENDCEEKTIRDYLKRFWMRGCHKNALLFDFQNSGKAQRYSAKRKLGRPNETMLVTGEPYGIVITEKIAGYFKAAIDKYLGKMPLSKIFIKVLNEHFSSGTDENGEPVHLPVSLQPTKKQFYYVWRKLQKSDPEKYAKLKKGRYGYLHAGRPTTGDSSASVYGPGYCYQSDATPLRIKVVSSINRAWTIGFLILYTVIDVFSHEIVGFSLGYGTTWADAVIAIECAFKNKVKFCAEHGIHISQEDWDVEGKCKTIVADLGSEWTSNLSDCLQDIDVDMAQPEAYRPELKGLVESIIKALKAELEKSPGAVSKKHKRSEPGIEDADITAALTRKEIEQLLIQIIITRNTTSEIVDYSLDKDMVAAGVPKIPADIWKWGIENRSGLLSEITEDTLRGNLWPKIPASISGNGILVNGKKYKVVDINHSEENIDEEMRKIFVEAKMDGAKESIASYHPDFPNDVYLKFEEDGRIFHCQLDKQDASFADTDWYEIEQSYSNYRLGEPERRGKRNQARGSLQSQVKQVVDHAVAETRKARRGLTKTEQRSDIKEKRRRERAYERAQNAGVSTPNPHAPANSIAPTNVEGYVGLPDLDD